MRKILGICKPLTMEFLVRQHKDPLPFNLLLKINCSLLHHVLPYLMG